MVEKLLAIAIIGVEPILWLLILMSMISFTVLVERLIAYAHLEKNLKHSDDITLRLLLEERLGILATFGSNAPFIFLCRHFSLCRTLLKK